MFIFILIISSFAKLIEPGLRGFHTSLDDCIILTISEWTKDVLDSK